MLKSNKNPKKEIKVLQVIMRMKATIMLNTRTNIQIRSPLNSYPNKSNSQNKMKLNHKYFISRSK